MVSSTSGKGRADLVARARIEASLAAARDKLHADAVPFPLGEIGRGSSAARFAFLERLGQHQRRESWAASPIAGRGGPSVEPGEERLVGRREAVPDLLDVAIATPDPSASAVLASRADTRCAARP